MYFDRNVIYCIMTGYTVIYRLRHVNSCTGIYQYKPRQEIKNNYMTSYDVI